MMTIDDITQLIEADESRTSELKKTRRIEKGNEHQETFPISSKNAKPRPNISQTIHAAAAEP